jgi:putative ABC transport system permease protein
VKEAGAGAGHLGSAWRIARRELRGGVGGFRVFLACLALGVAAIAAVGTVRESIDQGLAREGAAILGGDASVEFVYRFAEPDERAWLEEQGRVSEIVDFRSMAVAGDERGLTQVKAVDAAYPLVGAVRLDPPMPLDAALAGDGGRPGGVMDRILVERLGLAPGDAFRLGTQDFVLTAVLEREPDSATGGFGLGPRTIVRTGDLDDAGLLGPGTLFETEYRLALPDGVDLDRARIAAEEALGAGARWRDRRNAAAGLSEFVDRLSAFLVLTGLAGLAVGGVGISAAVRAYLDEKVETIATLKTVGAERTTIFLAYALQIALLTLAGLALGLAIGLALPLAAAPLIEARLPLPAVIGVYPGPLAEAALYGVLAAALFTLWPLARTEEVRAGALYRDVGRAAGRPRALWLWVTGGLLAALVGTAAVLSGIPGLTLWAAAGVAAAFAALVAAGWGIRRLCRRLARSAALRGLTPLRLAMGAVGGPGAETPSVVLSLGLGLTVLAAVGQIDWNLRQAIARDLPDVAPSFFVVDIQPDQLDGMIDRLEADAGVSEVETAPMLRGFVTAINGRPAEEVAGDHWVLSGDRGVTYAAEQPDGTVVTAGEWWPEDYAGPPLMSFAAGEAEEMGLELGDKVTVDILGREITAEIASFRAVDFSTAGIGFILAMNPSALAGAPHTHIATIYAEEAAEPGIMREFGRAYPNITLISIRDAIGRVSEVLAGIAAAVTWGASATLVTGAIVLVGAAAAGARGRTYEAAVLKTIGATRGAILANFALRSALTGAAAGLVAVVAGGIGGWAVSRFVMETEFRFAAGSAGLIVAGGIAATLLAGLAFAWGPLAARPARVLRARE